MAIVRLTQGTELFRPALTPWSIDGVASPGPNDVIILGLLYDNIATINSEPTGFTLIGQQIETANDFTLRLYYGVGVAGPYSVGFTANTAGVGFWLSYSGVDINTPMDVPWQSVVSGGVNTVVDTPSITPVTPLTRLLGFAVTESTVATSCTWDAGVTEVIDFNDVGAVPGFGVWIGEKPWTGSGSNQVNGDLTTARATVRATVALRPDVPMGNRAHGVRRRRGPANAPRYFRGTQIRPADVVVTLPDWVPSPVQNAVLPRFLQPSPQSVLYSPTIAALAAVDVAVPAQVKPPVFAPAINPRSVALNPSIAPNVPVLAQNRTTVPAAPPVPRSVAFNPLAASPGVDDAFYISIQSQLAGANARVVPPVVGRSSSTTPMVVPAAPPVEWIPPQVLPLVRPLTPPPHVAQSQAYNPLASSPGVNDAFFIRNVVPPVRAPQVQPKSISDVPFLADAYAPPQVKPVVRTEVKPPQSNADNVYFTPAPVAAWVPPVMRVYNFTTEPKPQTVCYQPGVAPFVEPEWLVTIQLPDPSSKQPPNLQAKSRAAGAFTPNIPPNVILSPWIQSAQYAARIRALKLHPSSTRWFPGGIYAGPTDLGVSLEGRNELGDLVGAGAVRGAAGSVGGASGRGSAGSAGAGGGRGTAGSAGSGTGRGSAGSVGPGGGRT